MSNYSTLLKNKSFVMLWSGFFVSSFGSWFRLIAISHLLYSESKSSFIVSLLWIVNFAPSILSPWLGHYVDKFERKKLMIFADVVRASLLFVLLFILDSSLSIYILFFVLSLFSILFQGAFTASFPNLIGKQNLLQANSLQTFSTYTTMALGPILAAFIIKAWGVHVAFIIDGITYLFSAFLLLLIPSESFSSHVKKSTQQISSSAYNNFKEGLLYIKNNKSIFSLCVMDSISMLGFGAYSALLIVFADKALSGGVELYGLLFSADAIGGILGALLLFSVSKLFKNYKYIVVLNLGVISLISIIFATLTSAHLAIAILLFEGVFLAFYESAKMTIYQNSTEDSCRGRVLLSAYAFSNIAMLISIFIFGYLSDVIGIRSVFVLAGIFGLIATGYGALRFTSYKTECAKI